MSDGAETRDATGTADLATEHLDVYDGKDGWWNPDHGVLDLPDGWDLLPRGDAFVTRHVKAAGRYWLAWLPRSRSRRHRQAIGVIAPSATIAQARADAEASEDKRQASRASGARSRARQEERYVGELEQAILDWLAFAPEHEQLARDIAQAASERAAVVGSGRVGRTRTLSLEDRAALAARAEIRHSRTTYEDQLAHVLPGDDEAYRDVKREAHAAVDEFLFDHRAHSGEGSGSPDVASHE